jgi:glycosyltransferase involved in cell wall biosynthesis
MDLPFHRSLHHRFFYGVIPSHYIANSRATRDSMVRSAPWLDPSSVTVIYNGIEVERFARAAPADLGLPDDAVAVGFVGRFEERKGIRELMSAWARVVAAVPNAHLVLAGAGGALAEDLARWAATTARVHPIGFREEMAGVMAAFDMIVVPSHFEGFGIVVAEAMAAGVPVIASRASNLPELLDDGVEGRLVPVRDPVSLAAAITELALDPQVRRAMGDAGQLRARRDYAIERAIDEYEAVLAGLLTHQKRQREPREQSSRVE